MEPNTVRQILGGADITRYPTLSIPLVLGSGDDSNLRNPITSKLTRECREADFRRPVLGESLVAKIGQAATFRGCQLFQVLHLTFVIQPIAQ